MSHFNSNSMLFSSANSNNNNNDNGGGGSGNSGNSNNNNINLNQQNNQTQNAQILSQQQQTYSSKNPIPQPMNTQEMFNQPMNGMIQQPMTVNSYNPTNTNTSTSSVIMQQPQVNRNMQQQQQQQQQSSAAHGGYVLPNLQQNMQPNSQYTNSGGMSYPNPIQQQQHQQQHHQQQQYQQQLQQQQRANISSQPTAVKQYPYTNYQPNPSQIIPQSQSTAKIPTIAPKPAVIHQIQGQQQPIQYNIPPGYGQVKAVPMKSMDTNTTGMIRNIPPTNKPVISSVPNTTQPTVHSNNSGTNSVTVVNTSGGPIPYLSTAEIQKRLDESSTLLHDWEKLLDTTENINPADCSNEDVARHLYLRRKLHENLGVLAKLVQYQLKQKKSEIEEGKGSVPAISSTTQQISNTSFNPNMNIQQHPSNNNITSNNNNNNNTNNLNNLSKSIVNNTSYTQQGLSINPGYANQSNNMNISNQGQQRAQMTSQMSSTNQGITSYSQSNITSNQPRYNPNMNANNNMNMNNQIISSYSGQGNQIMTSSMGNNMISQQQQQPPPPQQSQQQPSQLYQGLLPQSLNNTMNNNMNMIPSSLSDSSPFQSVYSQQGNNNQIYSNYNYPSNNQPGSGMAVYNDQGQYNTGQNNVIGGNSLYMSQPYSTGPSQSMQGMDPSQR